MFPTSSSNLAVIIGSVGAFFLLFLSFLFCYFFKVYIIPRRRINYNFVDNPIINPVNVSDPNNFVNTSSISNPFVSGSDCAIRNDSNVEDGENVSEMTVLQNFDSVLDSVQDFNSVTVSQNVRPVLNVSSITSENEDVFTDVLF